MAVPPFYVYVDESGDEGFSFQRGSSEWFVLAACVVRGENDRRPLEIVSEILNLYKNPQRRDLHFVDMPEAKRFPYVSAIAQGPLRAVAVLFHKPPLAERFDPGTRLYFYAVRYLLERVSWLCSRHRRKADAGAAAKVIFSNKSGLSYSDLRTYLEGLKLNAECSIDWSVIDPNRISALQHKDRAGLQVADAIASSFYCAVNKRYGVVDDRYARMLRPVTYRHRGVYLSYGVKIWPRIPPDDVEIYSWIDFFGPK